MATLTVTHSESLVLDGRNRGASKTFSITNIEEIYERTLTIPQDASTVLAAFGADVEGGSVELPVGNVKYIRVTNTGSIIPAKLAVIDSTNNYQVVLYPGQSHVLGDAEDLMVAEANTNTLFGTTVADIESLSAIAVGTASDTATLEVYIASAAS
jgi:hypothetical protein